jgi:hypothetical protein
MLRFRLSLVLLLALAACADVTGLDRLVITVVVTPDRIVPGDTAVIAVRITNPTPSAIEIPTRCSRPYQIANAQGETVVGNEGLICALDFPAPTVLGPFESIDRRITWNGYRERFTGVTWVTEPLAAGLYRVYGTVEGRRSRPETIEIEAPVTP